MLLNKGRHPSTNETIVPEGVLEHVNRGSMIAETRVLYPELVRSQNFLSISILTGTRSECKGIWMRAAALLLSRARHNRASRA